MLKKILFAVGGTGGHVLPAQALAKTLLEKNPNLKIVFAGADLSTNTFFEKEIFAYEEIKSASPFREFFVKATYKITKGFWQSLQLIKKFSPDLVIGFGSFHSFPILLAAARKKIPYILVETNAIPGKVNRLLSPKAEFTALQFQEASPFLKGVSQIFSMPLWSKPLIAKEEARKHYGLDPKAFTILVFGGSGGADAINQAAKNLGQQVIHLCGPECELSALKKEYEAKGIRAYVTPYEKNMHLAYSACDLCICRSGACTIAELTTYKIPAIFIPWPKAAEDHQTKNAKILSLAKAAILLEEKEIDQLPSKLEEAKTTLEEMKKNLENISNKRTELTELILSL